MVWKSDKFMLVKEQEYFRCISYAQHSIKTRGKYTKMIFDFYDTFFPGINVHQKGMVKVDDLALIQSGILQEISSDPTAQKQLEQFIETEIKRLKSGGTMSINFSEKSILNQFCEMIEEHVGEMIDFYESRNLVYRALKTIYSAEISNGIAFFYQSNVKCRLLVNVDDWISFTSLPGRFYQYYYSVLYTDSDGRIELTEMIKKYTELYDTMSGTKGFNLTPTDYGREMGRRYDINGAGRLTYEEAQEWVFCLAPFFQQMKLGPIQHATLNIRQLESINESVSRRLSLGF